MYRGRRFLTSEGNATKEDYAIQAKTQFRKPLITGDIALNITFTFSDRRKHDIDNCLKGLLDSMTGVLWKDDSQIIELHVFKEIGDKPEIYMYFTETRSRPKAAAR